MKRKKIIRITTIPSSLTSLLRGQLNYVSSNGYDVIAVSSSTDEEAIRVLLEKEDVKCFIPLEMTRTISPLKDLKALYKFYKICKSEKPDIVHSHTPKAGIIAMLGSLLARVPIRLHTVAGLPLMEAKGLKRKVLNFVEKLTYSCSSKVYPNSFGLYDFILKEKLTHSGKLHVLGKGSSNGINTTFFEPNSIDVAKQQELKKQLGISDSDFVFIFVGRLVGDKGINELIQAFSEVQFNCQKEIKLLLVGSFEPNLDPLLDSTLDVINNNKAIISVGFQNDVRPYFCISDLLVFPSYREGFPNVVMQSGSMGVPCIVSDINGCNEIIYDNYNGVIVPVKNSNAIKDAMLRILYDKEFYCILKNNSRDVICNRFEQEVVWNAVLNEYGNLSKEYK